MTNEEKLKRYVAENDTGECYRVPQVINFLAVASIIITKPIYYIAVLITLAVCFYQNGDISLAQWILAPTFWLIFLLPVFMMNLEKSDVSEEYLSVMYEKYAIPRFLKKMFGRSGDSTLRS